MIPFFHGHAAPRSRSGWTSPSRSGRPEVVLVAILGDRDSLDQLHDEERPPALGRAGVEHPGDVRMIHHRQGLAFHSNRASTARESIPGLMKLQRHHPLDRLGLLSEIDVSHAALADLLADLVPACDDGIEQRRVGAARLVKARSAAVGWLTDAVDAVAVAPGIGVGLERLVEARCAADGRRPASACRRARNGSSSPTSRSRNAWRSLVIVRSRWQPETALSPGPVRLP